MIRIYEGFIKPESCALPTKIVKPKAQGEMVEDVKDATNTSMDKGPAYEMEMTEIENYCVKIIGTTSKY